MRNLLYAVGGYNGCERLATVEVFDPFKKIWSQVSSMHFRRRYLKPSKLLYFCLKKKRQFKNDVKFFSAVGAAPLNDKLYVCGGFDGIRSLNTVECYDPDKDCWTSVTSMDKHRSAGGVLAFNGYLYAIGGHDGLTIFDLVLFFQIFFF